MTWDEFLRLADGFDEALYSLAHERRMRVVNGRTVSMPVDLRSPFGHRHRLPSLRQMVASARARRAA